MIEIQGYHIIGIISLVMIFIIALFANPKSKYAPIYISIIITIFIYYDVYLLDVIQEKDKDIINLEYYLTNSVKHDPLLNEITDTMKVDNYDMITKDTLCLDTFLFMRQYDSLIKLEGVLK